MQEKLNQGRELHMAGKLASAEAIYREILASDPGHGEALNLLGVLCHQIGKSDDGAKLIARAILASPEVPAFHMNLGNVLRDVGNHAEAEGSLKNAIKLNPDWALAHSNLGAVYHDLKRYEEAEECLRLAISLDSGLWEGLANMGRVLSDQFRFQEAAPYLEKAIGLQPGDPDLHFDLANALRETARPEESLDHYEKALELKPNFWEARSNLGYTLGNLRRRDEAVEHFRLALRINPDAEDTYNNLGGVLLEQGKVGESLAAFNRAMEIAPDYFLTHTNLANALKDQCLQPEAEEYHRRAVELNPAMAQIHSNLVYGMHYNPANGEAELLAEAKRWDDAFRPGDPDIADFGDRDADPDKKLRIGYVSADLRDHSVSNFMFAVLAAEQRTETITYCYAGASNTDDYATRLRQVSDEWRPAFSLDDQALCAQISEDRIDILVDLSGHTANNRLPAFAGRAAPVQVAYLGFPGTTGLREMDYRITDDLADPENSSDDFYTEKLYRLPGSFICYAPPPEAPEVGSPPVSGAGHITFASFNNTSKLAPEILDAWCAILDGVADSRLCLKSRALACPDTSALFLERFAARGISEDRIELLNYADSKADHFRAYNRVDIALDTFPYNGTTTTCEALWMGVPVITMCGGRHAGRVGRSLLTNAGLEELVTTDRDSFVQTAVELAGDVERLSGLRSGMRERLKASPVMDSAAFARALEQAYRAMWQRWCGERGR